MDWQLPPMSVWLDAFGVYFQTPTYACIIQVLVFKALFLKSKLISTVLKWFSDNNKSFAVVVGSRQKLTSLPFPYPPVTFGETVLKYETIAQYLGVTIDSCLTWKEHINSLTSKIKPKLGALARFSKCLPRAELDSIYKTTVQLYIDYGIIIWGHHSQCNLNMVQKF